MLPTLDARVRGCALLALLLLQGCYRAPTEGDCLLDGTCECKQRRDCAQGLDCVDGKCVSLDFDAGHGELGDDCALGGECQSGLCLPEGPGNGLVCSQRCDGGQGCGLGWQCKQRGGAEDRVCVPPFSALCQRCERDQDCNVFGDRCLLLPDGTRACGRDCELLPCPGGYSCLGVDGGGPRQCVPDTGSCDCSPASLGLTRACHDDAGLAVCFGAETCQGDGTWSACDAKPASDEVCDGEDNDCDGLVDQTDPSLLTAGLPGYPSCRNGDGGSCVGLWTCGERDGGFGFFCSAKPVEPEACNGEDDNCNGRLDEDFRDPAGRYADVQHCNACGFDCTRELQNLLTDGGVDAGGLPGAAACELRGGNLTCVPRQCAKGYYPWPQSAPQTCQRAATSQCRPCGGDSDCQTPGDRCVAIGGDPGSFCAQACEVTAPYPGCTGVLGQQGCCPQDSTCQLLSGQKLCVPVAQSCLCSPSRAGFKRSCLKDAGTASCVGTQVCGSAGTFEACDTELTAQELCDGADNDCDGTVDETFVNTRGSGTYDTDQQCGSCTQSCLAKWSPTIQHAVGGCIASATVSPSCQIVRCTQEDVAGGGACRQDSECGTGRSCHPVYRQCVRSCSSATSCGAGGACVGGYCTRSCSSDPECVTAFGAPSRCVAGACKVSYQFNDADKDSTNGCECPAATGGADLPDEYEGYPTAGLPYVDRDCDGVDGHAQSSLFVSAQSGSSQGTRAAPYRTIAEAITAFDGSRHSAILVAAGTYLERVVLKNGVKLYGGYSADFARRDVVTFPTIVEAPEPDLAAGQPRGTVHASGLSAQTVVAGFTIRGYDVAYRPPLGGEARSSYAVYVKDTGPNLVLRNNHIVGGRGGDAAAGVAGSSGGSGGAGGNGLPAKECTSASCANESQPGGAAGINPSCASTAGQGGASSAGNADPQAYTSTAGGNGLGGNNAIYRHSDPSHTAAGFCKYDCTLPAGNLNGGGAQAGTAGGASQGGLGCFNNAGSLSGLDWVASSGTAGQRGAPGRGGGGGGAGGCVSNQTPINCTVGNRRGDLGGTGGGGGAGGCGGTGGGPGTGGGGSFGIFVLYTSGVVPSVPTIRGNLIELGSGGAGGNGGAGGYGGLGGQGGEGGPQTSVAWCAGNGGRGGRGGNGGAGSGGGGGCGGSSFGIGGNFVTASALDAYNTVKDPPADAAGTAGNGGPSPAGGTSNGNNGAAGLAQKVRAF